MKALAKCPKCKESVETEDREDISSGTSLHSCGGKVKSVKVKWTVYPENEHEMLEEETLDMELPENEDY